MITAGADFAIYDQLGQLQALAEAKSRPGTSTGWARHWFRNFLAQGKRPPSYLLLATPDKMYLWHTAGSAESDPSPYEIGVAEVLGSYFHRAHVEPSRASSSAFEAVLGWWLNDFLHHNWEPSEPEQLRALIESGFRDAIKDGRIESGVAA